MLLLLGLAIAGATGSLVRHEALRRLGDSGTRTRAWGVASVNVVGAAVAACASVLPMGPALEAVVVAGFAGSLTTFSTWMVDVVTAPRVGRDVRVVALLDVVSQLIVGVAIVAVVLGAAQR